MQGQTDITKDIQKRTDIQLTDRIVIVNPLAGAGEKKVLYMEIPDFGNSGALTLQPESDDEVFDI
ncbi:hypothetical protein [Pleomorphovibrio marinus]|uniref:hypothetical protein n=1 Tax=Pleomorphovibrio marinus TaxID=2164132 RepID=UPI000E0C9411|nr:hypothetical protein [Pleomorphovibrio marinus]